MEPGDALTAFQRSRHPRLFLVVDQWLGGGLSVVEVKGDVLNQFTWLGAFDQVIDDLALASR